MSYVQLAYPPPDRESLWWLVQALFGVRIPRTQVCPDHCAPFDAFADAYFGECSIIDGTYLGEPTPMSRAIWHASRGLAGKSKTLSVLGLTFAYVDGADLTILGGSMAQSANVHQYILQALEVDSLPPEMVVDETASKLQLTNRGRIRPLPASQRTVRGPHPSVLLMDEVDEMDLDVYDAALGQPMPQPNYLGQTVETMTVLSSTWQNADGTFTEILRRAEELNQPVYRWCYRENLDVNNPNVIIDLGEGRELAQSEGWLTQKTITEKKENVSVEMFRIEYDLGEPSIGNRAFDTDRVDAAFCLAEDQPGGKILRETHRKDWDEWWFYNYDPAHRYVVGADWAKEKDKTVITVTRIDLPKRRIAYTARINRTAYPVVIALFNKAIRNYRIHKSGAWHDSTGLGNVIDDYVSGGARAFTMNGDKRVKLLSNYVNAVERGRWEFPKVLKRYYYEIKHCTVGDLYATSNSKEFHLPDTVCAGALAEHGARRVVDSAAPLMIGHGENEPDPHDAKFAHDPETDESRTSMKSPEPDPAPIRLLL